MNRITTSAGNESYQYTNRMVLSSYNEIVIVVFLMFISVNTKSVKLTITICMFQTIEEQINYGILNASKTHCYLDNTSVQLATHEIQTASFGNVIKLRKNVVHLIV